MRLGVRREIDPMGRITIPRGMCRAIGADEDGTVIVTMEDGRIVIERMSAVEFHAEALRRVIRERVEDERDRAGMMEIIDAVLEELRGGKGKFRKKVWKIKTDKKSVP